MTEQTAAVITQRCEWLNSVPVWPYAQRCKNTAVTTRNGWDYKVCQQHADLIDAMQKS